MQITIRLQTSERSLLLRYATKRGLTQSEAARELALIGLGRSRREAERINAELATWRAAAARGAARHEGNAHGDGEENSPIRFRLPARYVREAKDVFAASDGLPGGEVGRAIRAGLQLIR